MVGDYLFGDERFIKSLAQNKNLFQRIFDEIKYLLKIAGKGTKQEKEFARLKRAFEKALSESKAEAKAEKTKNTTDKEGDVKYSLSEVKIPTREELENKDPIEVIDIATSKTQGNFAERRNQILDNVDEVISKPYLNQDTKTMIFLTRKSYTHAFNNLGDIQLNAIEHLPELIENAVLTHAEKVTHGDTHANGIYTFFGAVRYNQVYPVKLKVKEYTYSGQDLPKNIKEYFENSPQGYASSYDTVVLEVEKIQESPLGSVKDTNQKDSFLNPNELSTISIADLLKLVKGKAKKYIPKERFNERFKVDNNDIRYSLSDDLAPLREDLSTDGVKYSLTKAQLEEEQQKLLDEQRLLDMQLESGDISKEKHNKRAIACATTHYNQGKALYIINFKEIAYHQNGVLHIIKSQRNTPSVMIYTLKRDDIRLAAMIYQVCDLDKKILQKMYPFLQYFLVRKMGFEPTRELTTSV